MLKISTPRLEIHKPGNDDPDDEADHIIAGDDIQFAEESQRVDKFKDVGIVEIWNGDGRHAGKITSGDMARFLVRVEDDADVKHRFTGMVRNVRYERSHDESGFIEVELGGYVGEIMASRRFSGARENRPIATEPGVGDGLINELIRRECPELDRSGIQPIPKTADVFLRQNRIKPVVDGLAAQGRAVVWGEDTTVKTATLSGLSPEFSIGKGDITGEYSYNILDDELANDVRIDGGDDYAEENRNEGVDAYETVTEADPHTFEFNTRKSEVDRIQLWTRPNDAAASDDEITVRLQAPNSDGTGPIAPGDDESDVARESLTSEFLADDGFTEFVFGSNSLPSRDMWVIVEGTGGHELGVDTDGDAVFVQFFPFPVIAAQSDESSISEYRRREYAENDDSLRSRDSVRNRVAEVLDDRSQPKERVEIEAESRRTHDLSPGDVVTFSRPRDAISGEWVVLEREDVFDGVNLQTNLTIQEVSTL